MAISYDASDIIGIGGENPGAVIFEEKDLVRAESGPSPKNCRVRSVCVSYDDDPREVIYGGRIMANVVLDTLYIFEQKVPSDFPEKLKTSLAKTLVLFPTLAGRLDPQTLWIICNNEGCAFTVKHHEGHASDVETIPERTKFQNFPAPRKVLLGEQPLLSVTIHMFKDGGAILATNINHIACDGRGVVMFHKSWSKMHKGQWRDITEPEMESPFFTLANYPEVENYRKVICEDKLGFENSKFENVFIKILTTLLLGNMRAQCHVDRVIITFTADECDQLKDQVKKRMQALGHKDGWCSTNEALAGFVHSKTLDLLDYPMDKRNLLGQTHLFDVRGRVPNLSTDYFGNCALNQFLFVDLNKNHWADISINIHDQIRQRLKDGERLAMEYHYSQGRPFTAGEMWRPRGYFWGFTPYVCEMWNSQINLDFIGPSDFGFGPASRFLPWMIGEAFKPVKNVDGDVEIHMSKDAMNTWVFDKYDKPSKNLFSASLLSFGVGYYFRDQKLGPFAAGCGVVFAGAGVMLKIYNDEKKELFWQRLQHLPKML